MRNPEAVAAMTDLRLRRASREMTIEDVLESRMIADPLHLLDCCMISDGGGAVVIASADVARDCKQTPVWILGTGEATKYPENGGDITTSAAAQSGPPAFGEAGVQPDEIDIAMIYDSFTITVLTLLEDLGFCKKGEGGRVRHRAAVCASTARTKPALNTDGGGLSSNHPGMRGIFLLIEATRQLRGESTSQVAGRAARRRARQRRHARQPPRGGTDHPGEGLAMAEHRSDRCRTCSEPDTGPSGRRRKSGELRYQVCDDCGGDRVSTRAATARTVSAATCRWKTSKGDGTVYTFSVVRQNRASGLP